MKRPLSIVLLLTFLFNVGGYYLVFLGLRYSQYIELSHRIDQSDYTPDETYEFKIPFTLPYPIQDNGYVRSHGEFEFNGDHYILAAQKLNNDTLYIKGVRNLQINRLSKVFSDYAKVSGALPSKHKQGNNLISKLIKEYKGHTIMEIIHQCGWSQSLLFIPVSAKPNQRSLDIVSPPPDRIS